MTRERAAAFLQRYLDKAKEELPIHEDIMSPLFRSLELAIAALEEQGERQETP